MVFCPVVGVVMLESRVAICVHCVEEVPSNIELNTLFVGNSSQARKVEPEQQNIICLLNCVIAT